MSGSAHALPDILSKVLRTDDLRTRFTRDPDYQSENRALVRLAQTLNATPRAILSELAEAALELCGAGSAGISILDSETGGDSGQFRWRALAGPWAEYLGALLPRDYSPCGVVLKRNSLQLMADPALYYDYVRDIVPACHEALLVPFYAGSEPVGTIWVVTHEVDRRFDSEDARLLTSLANFTAAAYQSLRSLEALEAYGRERTAEVAALAAANRSKDAFIATIAHELRNPLGPIRNSSTILLRSAGNPIIVKRAAEVIDRQVTSMTRLIGDLLDVSRVRLGVLELQSTEVNLGDVLRTALEASRLMAEPASHQVEMELSADSLRVRGDPLRLAQILENLFNNAAKYTDPDGNVRVRMFREAAHAVVSIADDGIGIAADQIDSIFDLFAQAGQAGTPRSQGGLGVGLHLARQLVESHKGTLSAASAGLGQGSTFVVRIPCI